VHPLHGPERSLAHYLGHRNPPLHCACAGSVCEVLNGLAVCESPWSSLGAGITPGALCCRSGFPPIPAEAARNYPESLAVTVLLRPQVQNCLLTRLKLILADQMAFAIQRFPGSSLGASGGRLIGEGAGLHTRGHQHTRACQMGASRIVQHNPMQSVPWHCHRNFRSILALISTLRGERVDAPPTGLGSWCVHSAIGKGLQC